MQHTHMLAVLAPALDQLFDANLSLEGSPHPSLQMMPN